MEVKFLKLAQAGVDDAVAFYESEQPGLGKRFRGEVLRSVSRLIDFPSAYQELGQNIRRCLIAKFPYGIIYHHDLNRSEILILAVGHLHRRPDYWTSRES